MYRGHFLGRAHVLPLFLGHRNVRRLALCCWWQVKRAQRVCCRQVPPLGQQSPATILVRSVLPHPRPPAQEAAQCTRYGNRATQARDTGYVINALSTEEAGLVACRVDVRPQPMRPPPAGGKRGDAASTSSGHTHPSGKHTPLTQGAQIYRHN